MRGVLVVIAIGVLASCGDRGDEVKRKARSTAEAVGDKAREVGGDLREVGGDLRAAGGDLVDRAAQAKNAAVALGGEVGDRVGGVGGDVRRAADVAAKAKAELDKVYRSTTDYDLDVTTAAATSAHAEKLAAMPHVTVGGVTVGYEQVAGLSTSGTTSKRHFRATWRRGDRDVIVGLETESRFDLAAFVALLPKLVPIVDRLL